MLYETERISVAYEKGEGSACAGRGRMKQRVNEWQLDMEKTATKKYAQAHKINMNLDP